MTGGEGAHPPGPGDDPAFEDALRRVRRDLRESREELEATLDEAERSQRSLDEVALEYLYRGDRIRLAVAGRSWVGVVVHVGAEVMTLRTPDGSEVDAAYDALTSIRVVERARAGGRSLVARHPGSLVARLRELVGTGEVAELGGPHLTPPVAGVVEAVAPTAPSGSCAWARSPTWSATPRPTAAADGRPDRPAPEARRNELRFAGAWSVAGEPSAPARGWPPRSSLPPRPRAPRRRRPRRA